MTRTTDAADPLLVDAQSAVDEPSSRRGPPQLPLKENDWNAVALSVRGVESVLPHAASVMHAPSTTVPPILLKLPAMIPPP
jgi:hypothetical protein